MGHMQQLIVLNNVGVVVGDVMHNKSVTCNNDDVVGG
jgi:hypothetical protein